MSNEISQMEKSKIVWIHSYVEYINKKQTTKNKIHKPIKPYINKHTDTENRVVVT